MCFRCSYGSDKMDLNQILAREQVAMMLSAAATDPRVRAAQNALIRGHGIRLKAHGFPHNPYPAAALSC